MDRLRAHAQHAKEKRWGKNSVQEQQTGRKFDVAKLCVRNRNAIL